jgi:hypothetical protein
MKLNNWVIGGLVVVSFLTTLGWIAEHDERVAMMDREVMCQVTRYENTHILPCRIVGEYLAVVSL